ncbi:MAG: hypothetical protein ACP5XB_13100 [Isosphaeraceae bacterium]
MAWRNHLNGEQWNVLNGLAKPLQGLHLGRVVPKPEGDTGRLPAERLHGFERHQPVSHFTEDVRGGDAGDFLTFDAFEQLRGGQSVEGVRLEVVDEHAGVQENGRAGG